MELFSIKTFHFEEEESEEGSHKVEVTILVVEPTLYLMGTFHRTDAPQPPVNGTGRVPTGTLHDGEVLFLGVGQGKRVLECSRASG